MPTEATANAAREVIDLARARRYASTGEGQQIRERLDLSLGEVARGVGCSPSTIFRWEAGERVPTGAPAVAWGRMLDELTKLL